VNNQYSGQTLGKKRLLRLWAKGESVGDGGARDCSQKPEKSNGDMVGKSDQGGEEEIGVEPPVTD